MGTPFSDIALHLPSAHSYDSPEYMEEIALNNYISDLYVVNMKGYKPPNTTRVNIQPYYHRIWNRTWKNGSLVDIAPHFDYDKYAFLNKEGRYQYLLDLIHTAMLQLSAEYQWEVSVFQKAYENVMASRFAFTLDYPAKRSGDKRSAAHVRIEKTETVTSVYILITRDASTEKIKLFDKKNGWWYDSAYTLAKNGKWFDNDRFGMEYKPFRFSVWYSLSQAKVQFEVRGTLQDEYNLERLFPF